MDHSKIGVRYAKALFEYAEENQVTDSIISDVELLHKSILEYDELNKYLNNPVIKSSEKIQFMNNLFGDKFHKITMDFIHLVIRHKRETHFNAICRRITFLYNEKMGIRNLSLVSAVELDKSSQTELEDIVKTSLNAKTLIVNTTINPEIIGGFILNMDDLRYDASIKSRINELHNKIKS
jgi:F-type H+-transporting ATPase subunit delta